MGWKKEGGGEILGVYMNTEKKDLEICRCSEELKLCKVSEEDSKSNCFHVPCNAMTVVFSPV